MSILEVWRKILGGKYEVSSLGNIRNAKRLNVLKSSLNGKGYLRVCLESKTYKIHKLVAEAFLIKKADNLQINHIDGNKLNNKLTNLEYVTPSYNVTHAYKNNLISSRKGEGHTQTKLKNEDIITIRNSSLSVAALSKKYNLHFSSIYRIINKNTWSNI